MADLTLPLKRAREQVVREWSAPAFEKLGSRIQQALLAEAVLILAATQDEDEVSDATVRQIVDEGWSWVIDEAQR